MAYSVKTLDEAKLWLRSQGVTVTQWADDHGFKRDDVYAVLNGRNKGYWGKGHRIAVALGVKIELDSGYRRIA